jgi:hypothetical protein
MIGTASGSDYIWESVEHLVSVADTSITGTVVGFERGPVSDGRVSDFARRALVEVASAGASGHESGDVVVVETLRNRVIIENDGTLVGVAHNLSPWLEIGDDVALFLEVVGDLGRDGPLYRPLTPTTSLIVFEDDRDDLGGFQELDYVDILERSFAADMYLGSQEAASRQLEEMAERKRLGQLETPRRAQIPGVDSDRDFLEPIQRFGTAVSNDGLVFELRGTQTRSGVCYEVIEVETPLSEDSLNCVPKQAIRQATELGQLVATRNARRPEILVAIAPGGDALISLASATDGEDDRDVEPVSAVRDTETGVTYSVFIINAGEIGEVDVQLRSQ